MSIRRWRPLDRFGALKLKLSVIIVGAIGVAAVVSQVGFRLGWPVWVRPIISAAIGVGIMWVFAGGITRPVREMASAAEAMAGGDHDVRVTETSRDEIGDLARAFNDMAAQLGAVDQQRRDLVAMVSHELRTPIAALRAHLENIADGVSEPDDQLIGAMLGQTERLSRLITQLLDLSRIESGSLTLDRDDVAATELIAAVVDEARLHRPELSIATDVVPPDLAVSADRERLHQALANLVDNAARFSPAGEPVTVRAERTPSGVSMSVVDRGPGIPSDDRLAVFERYRRVTHDRSAAHGGTGLGLAIAAWMVELHGGSIRAEAAAPTGCQMVLTLPDG